MKRCRNCFIDKDESQFSKQGNRNHLRPYCRECRTVIESRRIMERKLEEFPTRYWECDNCFRIISKRTVMCKCGENQIFNNSRVEEIHDKA